MIPSSDTHLRPRRPTGSATPDRSRGAMPGGVAARPLRSKPRLFLARLTVMLLLTGTCALAADPSAPLYRSSAAPTREVLSAKMAEVDAAAGIDEATKSQLAAAYRQAIRQLEAASSYSAAAEAFARARTEAPRQAIAIRQELETAEKSPPPMPSGVSEEAGLPEVEQERLKEEANLAAVNAELAALEEQLTSEAERPVEVRQRIVEVQQRQEQLDAERKRAAAAEEDPSLVEARRWELEAEDRALSAEIQRLDQELLSQPVRVELLRAQRDQATRKAQRIGERVLALEEASIRLRSATAESAQAEAEAARREAEGKHPLVQEAAEENAALSEELRSLAVDLERVTSDQRGASEASQRIEEGFRRVRQKLEIAGLSQALGRVLFEQRRELPNPRVFRKRARASEQLVAASGLRQIGLEEERRRLRDLGAELSRRTAGLGEPQAGEVRDQLRPLLQSRQVLLDQVIDTNAGYLTALGELDFVERHLLGLAEEYDRFLAGRLLWARSSGPVSLGTLRKLPAEVGSFLSPTGWLEVLALLGDQATHTPIPALAYALFGVLVWRTRRLRDALQATGNKVGKIVTDRFAFSIQALALTLLLATPWPLLLAALGWQLRFPLETTEFTSAVAVALLAVSKHLFFLQVFRLLCTPGGLGAAHFRWSPSSTQRSRREAGRLMGTFLPAGFVVLMTNQLEFGIVGGELGRFAFVAAMIALAAFCYGMLHPERGVLQGGLLRRKASLLARLSRLWFPLVVAAPLGFAGVALAGYVYAAGTLVACFVRTFWLILVLFVAHQFAVRWLLLVRRRLAYRAALERREAARAAAETEETAPAGGEAALVEIEEPRVDLAALSETSRKLVNLAVGIAGLIGLWLVWSAILPALGVLDDVTLWTQTSMVAGVAKPVPVTLADLTLAILIAVVTLAATRNLPSLLEIVLLQRLNLSTGGRYATTTLSRYLIAGVGILLTAGTLGFAWSQIQWLVAALGVGIGFGLQEIVANFISGLIILFERPIRIGDVVTVGDTDGVVTRIQIRATTIRNWDQKELLVPNKEFITARLLNWTLSDPVTRLLVPVGIAYGSDVQQAMALMAEAAERNERVIEDPKPFVTFDGFGDNALTLTLRCYVDRVDDRINAMSELRSAINRTFNEAGVVIAFPQRDLHLHASRPLDVRLRHAGDDPPPGEKRGA